MATILLIEDVRDFQLIVSRTLQGLDHEVVLASTAAEARVFLQRTEPDLILLDISLPDANGLDLYLELRSREHTSGVPVIFLTGSTGTADKVTAFSLGAEDYIVKPFDPLEFRARLEAKLRKTATEQRKAQTLRVGDLVIHLASQRASLVQQGKEKLLELTSMEFRLLCVLAQAIDRVFTRDQLLVSVWGHDADVYDRTVDAHICGLRKKLGSFGARIVSVRNSGYKLEPPGTPKSSRFPPKAA